MAYTLHTLAANSKYSYGSSRKASAIKYIVLHYTANSTDTAKANANYYSANGSNTRKAGAHYFVDDTTVYQSVDDLYTAYSVGGSKYSDSATTGGATMYGTITNSNSISIEMCSKNSVITDATTENAVALTKTLMSKYDIPASRVYRHFDVTGKYCPGWTGWYSKNSTLWTAFKAKLTETNTESEEDDDDMTEERVKEIFTECIAEYVANEEAKDVSTWAKPAWDAACDAGVFDGTKPRGNLTREQGAQVLQNLGLVGTGTSGTATINTEKVE